MAEIFYKYGTMNSGKTIDLIITAHNYERNDCKIIVLKPLIDIKGGNNIVTRIGLERKVDFLVSKDDSIIELLKGKLIDISAIFVDEVQFLTKNQIDELHKIAHILDIPVMCYGLRTDFLTDNFEGSKRLLEIAENLQEIVTYCKCGKKAIFAARKINNEYVTHGDSVAIDGVSNVEYDSLCGDCYLKNVKKINFFEEKTKLLRKE